MTSIDLVDFAATAAMLGLTSLTAALGFAGSRSRASRCLSAFFACLALEYLVGTVMIGWGEHLSAAAMRWLHVFNVSSAYLLGPLLYGYAIALTSAPAPMSPKREFAHVLPALAVLLFSLANALFALDGSPGGWIAFQLTYHAWVLQGAIYFALAARQTWRARPLLEHVSADEAALHLAWLRWLALIMEIGWVLAAIDRLPGVSAISGWLWLTSVLNASIAVALYFLAWFGLRQRILLPSALAVAPPPAGEPAAAPYARSGLDDTQCATVAAQLHRLMTEEHLYVDSQLDLQMLSRRSGWPPNYISQALSQGLGRNFFEFVNGFRVEAARRCLADADDRRTVLDIALACGFGSKSTFNTVFKRMTGATPRGWRLARPVATDEPAA